MKTVINWWMWICTFRVEYLCLTELDYGKNHSILEEQRHQWLTQNDGNSFWNSCSTKFNFLHFFLNKFLAQQKMVGRWSEIISLISSCLFLRPRQFEQMKSVVIFFNVSIWWPSLEVMTYHHFHFQMTP